MNRSITRVTVTAMIGLAAFLPSVPDFSDHAHGQTEGVQIIAEDARTSARCVPPTGTNDSPLVEAWRVTTPISYRVHENNIPNYLNRAEVIAEIQAAAAAWATDGGPAFVYDPIPATSGVRIGDGTSVISFDPGAKGKVATAFMKVVNGNVVELDIRLNKNHKWATNTAVTSECGGTTGKFDLRNTLTHEFGHARGAAHTPLSSAYDHRTMFPQIAPGELFKRMLVPGDIASIPSLGSSSGFTGNVSRDGDDDG